MATVTFSPSTIAPGDPIVVSMNWTGVGIYFDIYVQTVTGEDLAASWHVSTAPNSPATFQDGYSGENTNYADPSVVTLYRAAGWDIQANEFAVRVETGDSSGGDETHADTYALSSTLPIVREPAHAATGLGRMLDQFKGSANLRSLASSYLDQAQSFEDIAYQLINAKGLAIVSGDRLDGLGQIVGVSRSGRTDEDYRLRIRAELAVLTSQGSTEDVITIAQLLLKFTIPDDIEITEYYPKMLVIRPIDHILTQDATTIGSLLKRSVSAATQLWFLYSEQLDANTFTLSSQAATLETSNLLGLSNDTQTSGGYLANVV